MKRVLIILSLFAWAQIGLSASYDNQGVVFLDITGILVETTNDVLFQEMPNAAYAIRMEDGVVFLGPTGGIKCLNGEGVRISVASFLGKTVRVTGRFRHSICDGILHKYNRFGVSTIEEVSQ